MWLATTIQPPSYTLAPGEETYQTYPNAITGTTDLRDALNWEASGENPSTWSTYFYYYVAAANLSQAALQSDIQADIWNVGEGGVPPVVDVNTAYLPNWQGTGKSLAHFVAIIGYNNNASTYTYIDTCGQVCGSNGNGLYTISQTTLYNAIKNNIHGGIQYGGLVW